WKYMDGETEKDFSTSVKINAATVVYATWIQQVTVTFMTDKTGGTQVGDVITVDIGSKLTGTQIPAALEDRYAQKFVKWVYMVGTTETDFTTSVAINSNTVVYAKWQDIMVEVTFDANGGTVKGDSTYKISIKKGTPIGDQKPGNPTWTKHIFLGWFNGDEEYTNFNANVEADLTLTAHWQEEYTITFNANGGTLTGSATMTTGADATLAGLPSDPTRDLYTFKGWYTTQTGNVKVTTSYVFTGDVTVYAQWTIMANGLYVNGKTLKASWKSNGTTEVMATGVELSKNDKIAVIYGGQVISYKQNTYSTTKVSYSNGAYTIGDNFAYDFYLKISGTDKDVLYVGSRYMKINVNSSNYIYITVEEKDTLDRDMGDTYIHAWPNGGEGTKWPGQQLVSNGASITVNSTLANLRVIINRGDTGNGNYQTADLSGPGSGSWVNGSIYSVKIQWNDNLKGGNNVFTKLN
ncbi:MAG: InlB B-repeat-containing protein, partial [Clostridiales bacterium]|nr:InlB B-repeat-containing protein [Clostridiales bacterium]